MNKLKLFCFSLAGIAAVFTIVFLFSTVIYVGDFIGGIDGFSAIFGGRVTLENVNGIKTLLDLNASVLGMLYLIFAILSIVLLVYAGFKQNKKIMNLSGVGFIVATFMNLACLGMVDVGLNVGTVSSPIAVIIAVFGFIIAFACFLFVTPLNKNNK